MPEFSVLLRSHNSERFVAEAIDSVLEQTHGDFELIVVDEGSEDGSWDIIAAYGHPRMSAIQADRSSSPADALNAALAQSSGDLIASLAATDRLVPDALEVIHKATARQPDAAIFSGRFSAENASTRDEDPMDPQNWIGRCPVPTGAAVRRDVLETAGGYRKEAGALTTWDLFLRLWAGGARIHVLPDVLQGNSTRPTDFTGEDLRAYVRMSRETLHPHLGNIGREDLIVRNIQAVLAHEALLGTDDAFIEQVIGDCVAGDDIAGLALAARAISQQLSLLQARASAAEENVDELEDECRHLEAKVLEREYELRATQDRLEAAEIDRRRSQADLERVRGGAAYRAAKRARDAMRRKG